MLLTWEKVSHFLRLGGIILAEVSLLLDRREVGTHHPTGPYRSAQRHGRFAPVTSGWQTHLAGHRLAAVVDAPPGYAFYIRPLCTGHDASERYTVPDEHSSSLTTVLREMTAASDVTTTLPADFVVALRFAALVALDVGRDSYLSLLRAAAEQGLVLDDAQQVLIVLAPLLGTEHIDSAASKVAEAVRLLRAVRDANAEQNSDNG